MTHAALAVPEGSSVGTTVVSTLPLWHEYAAPTPPGGTPYSTRWPSTMVYDAADGYPLWFGFEEYNPAGVYVAISQTWRCLNGSWQQLVGIRQPNDPMGQMAYYPPGQEVVYVGSHSTWSYHAGNWSRLNATLPATAAYASVAYDAYDKELIAFGGLDVPNFTTTGGTWELGSSGWKLLLTTVDPSARVGSAMTYDPHGQALVLFGGMNCSTYLCHAYNDTWEFRGGNWSLVHATRSPPPTSFAGFVFDPEFGAPILSGGTSTSGPYSMWLFEAGNWTTGATTADPYAAYSSVASLAYDSARGYLIECRVDYFGQTTVWGFFAPSAALEADRASADVGQEANFTAAATSPVDASPYTYSWSVSSPLFGCQPLLGRLLNCLPLTDGSFRVELDVTDSAGASVGVAFTFTVYPDPVLGAPSGPLSWADIGEAVNLSVGVSGGSGVYQVGWNATHGGCIASGLPKTQCFFDTVGEASVSATLTDSNGFTVKGLGVLELPVFPEFKVYVPAASSPGVDSGRSVYFNATIQGGNFTHAYTVLWLGLETMNCVGTATAQVVCQPTEPGSYPVQVIASDARMAVYSVRSPVLNFTVYGVLSLLPMVVRPSAIDVGSSVEFSTALVGGPPGPQFSVWVDLPAGCLGDALGGTSCTPTQPGEYAVYVIVEDTEGAWAASPPALLTVNARLSVLGANVTGGSARAGSPFNLTVETSGGTAPLRYNFTAVPPGCGAPGGPALVCDISDAGSYLIGVSVTDAWNQTATASLPIVVTGAPASSGPSGAFSSMGGPWLTVAIALLIALGLAAVSYPWGRRRRRPRLKSRRR